MSLQRRLVLLAVVLHTAFVLFSLSRVSENVFAALQIGLKETTHGIRTRMARNGSSLSEETQSVIHRLESPGARAAYLRFGHSVFVDCDYCSSYEDYSLLFLTRYLAQYTSIFFLLGLTTMNGSGRECWRTFFLGLAAALGIAEIYYLLTSSLTDSSAGIAISVHDQVLLMRRLTILALPWVSFFVPVSRSKEGLFEAALRLQTRFQELASTSHMLRLMSQAVLREHTLQRKSAQHWSDAKLEGEVALNDAAINDMARRLGIDIAEGGQLRRQTMARIKDFLYLMNKKR